VLQHSVHLWKLQHETAYPYLWMSNVRMCVCVGEVGEMEGDARKRREVEK
jgi:hypothetical protein